MDEYVKKEDVVLALLDKGQRSTRYNWGESWELNLFEIRESIDYMKSEDVEPVRHGQWIDQNGDYVCSVCGWEFSDELPYMARKRDAKTEEIMRYCMHCGAKLDGGVKVAE